MFDHGITLLSVRHAIHCATSARVKTQSTLLFVLRLWKGKVWYMRGDKSCTVPGVTELQIVRPYVLSKGVGKTPLYPHC